MTYLLIQNEKRGFIALMSAVIISAILMALLFTTSAISFNARFDAFDSENKHMAENIANSCVDQAVLRIAQNYSYDPITDPTYVAGKGVPIVVGNGTCYITSTTPGGPRTGNSAKITISVQSVYKNTFSDFKTQITAWNPSVASFIPPPSCYIWTNTNSISSGQAATIGWTSSNAVSMKILAQNNHAYDSNPATVPSGSQNVTLSASETFVGTVTNSVGSAQCTTPSGFIVPSIIVQPPATCADTVMIFDRTGSQTGTDLSNEKNAANTLLSLYQGATPPGQVAIGSFGGLDGSSASIPTNGHLSKNWSNLTNAINSITGSNSSVGSNLSSAITVADTELASTTLHDSTKAKVLVFVSDGEPNQPTSSTTLGSFGLNPASASIQNATGDNWTNPTNAYANGSGAATDIGGHRERFYNFNFGSFPVGSTIHGIEVSADAWTTPSTIVATSTLAPTGLGIYDQWTSNTGTDIAAVSTNDADTSYVDTSVNIETYAVQNAAVPAGALVNSVTITAVAKGTANGANMQLVTEKSGTVNIGATIPLSTSYATYTRTLTVDPSTGNPWTATEVNAWTTKFGVRTTAGTALPRVTQFFINVNYSTISDSGYRAPTSTVTPNTWTNPTRAFSNDTLYATDSTNGHQQGYAGFGFAIPPTATITGVEITVQAKNVGGFGFGCAIGAELSSNAVAFTTTGNNSSLSNFEGTDSLGNSSNLWGRSWTPTDFNNSALFILRVQNNRGPFCGGTANLNQLQARVYYSSPSATTSPLIPISFGNYNQWTANSAGAITAVSTNDADTSYIDTSTSIDTFTVPGSALPANATITSVTLTAVARGNSAGATLQLVTEKSGTVNIGPTISLSTTYTPYTRTMFNNPGTGLPWTVAEVNTWSTSFGIRTTASTSVPRVTQISIAVAYTYLPATPACQLGVDLSWNGGTTWTTEKTVAITGSEATYMFGSPTDDWSAIHTWATNELSNANFRVRVHNIDPDPGSNVICPDTATANLDWLQAKIDYSVTQAMDPSALTVAAANTAKSNGVQIFTVRYSTDSNSTAIAMLQGISSGPGDYFSSPITQAGISAIFNTIATQVCPAALPPAVPPTPPAPPLPPPPPPNITIGSWQEATTTH
jgi:hypothetical protein